MRIFVTLFFVFFVFIAYSGAHAQDSKAQLYDQCVKYKKDASYCECAMGKPYDELAFKQKVYESDGLMGHLKKLEEDYRTSYDSEISGGGLNPSQIDRICDVFDEYYVFLDEIGLPYKIVRIGKNNILSSGQVTKAQRPSREISQALTLKRRELNKKIHDLNNKYQRGGAMGSGSGLGGGVCHLEYQVQWLKEEIELKKSETANAPVNIGIRPLLAQSMETCGGY